jgi:hypothetical protein
MRLLALTLALMLTACSTTVPVKQKFPDVPKELLEKCPDLKKAEPDTKAITDLLRTVVENYGLYYQCSLKQDGWTEWYDTQKKIFDSTNK